MTVGVNEELALVEWLAGTPEMDGSDGWLGSDSELWSQVNGVYDDMNRAKGSTPFIRITHQDAFDVRPVGVDRALTNVELLIRVTTGGTDRASALAISGRLDELLNTNQNITTPELMVCGVGRIEPFWAREIAEGDVYLHAGGVYGFAVHAL